MSTTVVCGVMPAPAVLISGCDTCPQTCSLVVLKRTVERVVAVLPWHHRLDFWAGKWTLKSVKHTVKQPTGASLAVPAYDPTLAYAAGKQVSVGTAIYQAPGGGILAGVAPWTVGNGWVLQSGLSADVYVPLDTDHLPTAWVDKQKINSSVILEGGAADTDYRVEAMATFKDCEGREIQLWDCILVRVVATNG